MYVYMCAYFEIKEQFTGLCSLILLFLRIKGKSLGWTGSVSIHFDGYFVFFFSNMTQSRITMERIAKRDCLD